MFKLVEKKEGVGIYYPMNNKVLADTKNGLLYGDKIILKPKKDYFSNIKVYNDFVYAFEYKVGLTFFNINNINEKKEKDFINTIGVFLSEYDIIYSYNSKDYSKKYKSRINLKTNEKKWTIESYFGNGEVYDNYLYTSCINNKICKIDLDHPEQPIWHFDLQSLGSYKFLGSEKTHEVLHFLGIKEGKLFVQLKDFFLLVLDEKTGKLIKLIDFIKTFNWHQEGGNFYPAKMHLQDNHIYWLTGQRLISIDLKTLEPKLIKAYYQVPKKERWMFKHNTFHKDKIYFVADYGGKFLTASYVGVMDAKTGEVEWYHYQEIDAEFNEAPKVTDDKLYVRSALNILYIFEKTRNESV